MEKQKPQKSQQNIEEEEQIWRTDATQFQNLFWNYINPDSMAVAKEEANI